MSGYKTHVGLADDHLDAAARGPFGSAPEQYHLAIAQVHATLAQAAATWDLAEALQPVVEMREVTR